MTGFCDLHTHSLASDGSCSPAELVAQAQKAGLSAIALTDHNTVAGLPEFLEAAKGTDLWAVPGIEFSTDWGETELHIVGLFIGEAHYDAVNSLLAQARQWKQSSNLTLIQDLNQAGIPIRYEHVVARTEGIPNRAHFAAELTQMGVTGSIKEAIHTLLSPKNGVYKPPRHLDALETIDFIHELGAVAILAHPFLNLKEPALREFLSQAKNLDAMETLYTDFTPELTQRAQTLAKEFGLLESGGTDFHGANKPHINLGDTKVPMEFLDKLFRYKR